VEDISAVLSFDEPYLGIPILLLPAGPDNLQM
jgi:hypothetical protein